MNENTWIVYVIAVFVFIALVVATEVMTARVERELGSATSLQDARTIVERGKHIARISTTISLGFIAFTVIYQFGNSMGW